MQNPFEEIFSELQSIKAAITDLKISDSKGQIEIIDRAELLKRLNITEPTAIHWGKKGKIPEIRIGNSVRYNWPAVIEVLSKKK